MPITSRATRLPVRSVLVDRRWVRGKQRLPQVGRGGLRIGESRLKLDELCAGRGPLPSLLVRGERVLDGVRTFADNATNSSRSILPLPGSAWLSRLRAVAGIGLCLCGFGRGSQTKYFLYGAPKNHDHYGLSIFCMDKH